MAVLQGLLAYLFYDSWIAAIFLFPIGIGYMKEWRKNYCHKKEIEFREEFKDAIQMMSSALKVGYSVENAIRETEKDLRVLYQKKSIIRKEFVQMVHEMDMNVTAVQILKGFAERIEQEDVSDFVEVFVTAKRFGGDSIGVLKNTIYIIGSKIETEREIQTILAAKKLEFHIMCVIPLVMILYMKMTFSEFLSILYGNFLGILMMSICMGIYMIAYRMGRRMIQIEL